MAAAKFRYVGDHAQDLPGGQVLAPGDFVKLTKEEQEDSHVMDLMASGMLIGTGSVSRTATEDAAEEVAKND